MTKSRLTITLSDEILNSVDDTIDGKNIRNRSHAIEALLVKQLSSSLSQAVILIGGRPAAIKNTLINISGKPLILHTLDLLKKYGLNRIYIAIDQPYMPLKKILPQNQNLHLIKQRPQLGTAGALYDLRNQLANQPFLVIHSDIFTDINLELLSSYHSKQNRMATICVQPKLNKQQYGKVIIQGNHVTQFLDHPANSEVGMINTGIYLFKPTILPRLKKRGRLMLETDIFPILAKEHQLSAYPFEGTWYEVKQ